MNNVINPIARVLIELNGGCLVSASADQTIELRMIDHDNGDDTPAPYPVELIQDGSERPTLEINKELVLSTAHISEAENTRLFYSDIDDTAFMDNTEHAYRVHCESAQVFLTDPAVLSQYPNLAACVALAIANDCKWLLLDQDGNTIDTLPVFNW